uniref:Uncharacterized protein n=1 Tax=Glossina austeni TaxID=7395 RepID=A0A1A9VHH7_GLOAU
MAGRGASSSLVGKTKTCAFSRRNIYYTHILSLSPLPTPYNAKIKFHLNTTVVGVYIALLKHCESFEGFSLKPKQISHMLPFSAHIQWMYSVTTKLGFDMRMVDKHKLLNIGYLSEFCSTMLIGKATQDRCVIAIYTDNDGIGVQLVPATSMVMLPTVILEFH